MNLLPNVFGRPIPVWLIFWYTLYVGAAAAWIAFHMIVAKPDDPYAAAWRENGALGIAISLVPAATLFSAGASLIALRKWTVWLFGLNALIIALPLVFSSPTSDQFFWLGGALTLLTYVLFLRLRGVLK